MTGERAIVFDCSGERLVGICSGADVGATTGVLIVVGGPQYRVGCHRQFVRVARALAAAGVPAMRFDYRGMGDSGGAVRSFQETVPDIAAALDAFAAACPSLERVVLWGLCDGASASLLYWHETKDPRVAAMMLLNPWVSSDEKFAKAQIRQSMQRLLQREFWVKVLSGGIDVAGAVRKLVRAVAAAGTSRNETRHIAFQTRMASALQSFAGPVLIALSGRDLVAMEFAELCRSDTSWGGVGARRNIERYDVPEADHTFSDAACSTRVEAAMLDWLKRSDGLFKPGLPPSRYPLSAGASRST